MICVDGKCSTAVMSACLCLSSTLAVPLKFMHAPGREVGRSYQ